jgi:hypothetical protein
MKERDVRRPIVRRQGRAGHSCPATESKVFAFDDTPGEFQGSATRWEFDRD